MLCVGRVNVQPPVVDESSQVSLSLTADESQAEVTTLRQELLNKQQV